jgi:protein-tyrosine phosphatase
MDEGHDSSEDEEYLYLPSTIIKDKLYLSCASIAGKKHLIDHYGIKGVISLGSFYEHVTYTLHPEPVNYHFVFINDHEDEPIELEFKECIKFINQTEGPVLVHCMAGISRSATIVIAYLMSERKMSYAEAYNHVKEKRRIIRPNSGFRRQLKSFEKEVFQNE